MNDFVWNIKGELWERLKACKPAEKIEGDIVKTNDGTKWMIRSYPNGKFAKFEGICSIYLLATQLPPNKQFIAINYRFEIDEIGQYHSGNTFTQDAENGPQICGFKLKQIESLR